MISTQWVLALEAFDNQLNDYIDANVCRKGNESDPFTPVAEGHSLYDSAIRICQLAGWRTLPIGGSYRPSQNFRRLVAATGGMPEKLLSINGFSNHIIGDDETIGEAIELLLLWVQSELDKTDKLLNKVKDTEHENESDFEERQTSYPWIAVQGDSLIRIANNTEIDNDCALSTTGENAQVMVVPDDDTDLDTKTEIERIITALRDKPKVLLTAMGERRLFNGQALTQSEIKAIAGYPLENCERAFTALSKEKLIVAVSGTGGGTQLTTMGRNVFEFLTREK
jgi:hypothetical protein